MSRYLIHLAYKGTRYAGWQIQVNAETVQGKLHEAFSLITREEVLVTGCGRTDTGVHSSSYFAHFDFPGEIPENLVYRLNSFLPKDIIVYSVVKVSDQFHARFSAEMRTYKYLVDFAPSIFMEDEYYYCPYAHQVDVAKMSEAAELLPAFESFYPFCKSKVEVEHYKCIMTQSQWEQISSTRWVYTVKANRFLRGMVRMIVGMCINVGRGRLKIEEVETALKLQKRLERPWSAPAEGLYLYEVEYGDEVTRVPPNQLFFPI